MNLREIREARHRIDALLDERKERMTFVRQAPSESFKEFAEGQVAAVDREVDAIRTQLVSEGWAT